MQDDYLEPKLQLSTIHQEQNSANKITKIQFQKQNPLFIARNTLLNPQSCLSV